MGSQGLTNWGIRRGREKERGIKMRGKGEFPKRGMSKEREKYYLCPDHSEVMKGSKKTVGEEMQKLSKDKVISGCAREERPASCDGHQTPGF